MTITARFSYNLREAAAATGVSTDVLRRAIHRGELAAKKSGRNENGDAAGTFLIKTSDLADWFDGLVDA